MKGDISMVVKSFKVNGVRKDGFSESVTVFYGTMRGDTTWFAKNDKGVSCKITKSKKGVLSYGSGKCKCIIEDESVINYISKDL